MIEFEKLALLAPVPVRTDERAAASITAPDEAANVGGNVPIPWRAALPLRNTGRSRSRSRADLSLLELLDQGVQCAVEHLGHVARGDGMAEQDLRVAELVVGALGNRDLDQIGGGMWGRRAGASGRRRLDRVVMKRARSVAQSARSPWLRHVTPGPSTLRDVAPEDRSP